MTQIMLTDTDESKTGNLMSLLKDLSFVEISPSENIIRPKKTKRSFLDNAGMWADKDIDAKKLREKALGRNDGAK